MRIQLDASAQRLVGKLDWYDPPLIQIEDRFDLALAAAPNPVVPLGHVTITWTITPKNGEDPKEWVFTVRSMSRVLADDVAPSGSVGMFVAQPRMVTVTARRRGSGHEHVFPVHVGVGIEDSDCVTQQFHSSIVDALVVSEIKNRLADIDAIGFQKRVTGSWPNLTFVDQDISATWVPNAVHYELPLTLSIPKYFDVNWDLSLTLRASMLHTESESWMDVGIQLESDFSFSLGEDILSLGSSKAVESILEKLFDKLADAALPLVERIAAEKLLSLVNANRPNDSLRFYSIRIESTGGGLGALTLTWCP